MPAELLLGDEAVGLAALHSGVGGAFSYPGTPATEIMEFIQRRTHNTRLIAAHWSPNEKVAYEEALGMSYAGRRALVSMKHVGLNVAADPFMSSALSGVNAGLVLAVADDPGMHSSQNEQDSRYFADFARIPVFEPCNQQECYDLTRHAFEFSEKVRLPVMVRLVTRVAHSRADVTIRSDGFAPRSDDGARAAPDWRDWTLLPPNARRRFLHLIVLQTTLHDHAGRSPFNRLTLAGPRGIIATGIAYNYVRDALGDDVTPSILKISVYPPPLELIRRLVDHCDEIFVIEEGYPFVERQLVGLLGLPRKAVRGKLNGDLPASGELTPDIVAATLGITRGPTPAPLDDLAARPPQLCRGCPHADTFRLITAATAGHARPALFSDIGCYTLGAYPPHNAVHTCVDMGASIAMAHGAAQAGAFPVICTIGDSTFAHSGMTALLSAVRQDANMTVFILDNAAVAMTGGQESLASGEDLINLLRGLGVAPEHLVQMEPLPKNHDRNLEMVNHEIAYRGLSVIVSRRACIQIRRKERPRETAPAEACAPCGATH